MSKRDLNKEKRIEEIFEAALQCFNENGYDDEREGDGSILEVDYHDHGSSTGTYIPDFLA